MDNINKLKIDSLSIKNFKGILSLNVRFEEKNIVVLDGPNGYGKTTIFDAIDIILTGFPRKFKSAAIDARHMYDCSPIHNDQAKPMELSLSLKSSEESINIRRCFGAATKGRCKDYNIKNVFDSSTLYINDNLSSQSDLEGVIDYSSIITHFNVLNYVEQDENTFFIKKNPKERYDDLSSILGAHNQVVELEKIRKYHDLIKKILGNKSKRKKEIIKANKNVVYLQNVNISYLRLLMDQDYMWDRESISNSNIETHQEYLRVINSVKNLIENKQFIADIKYSDTLHRYIKNEVFLQKIITEFWHINNFELLQKEDIKRQELEKRNVIISLILTSITNLEYKMLIDEVELDLLRSKDLKIDVNLFKIEVESIISLKASLSTHNAILSDLNDRQKELLRLFSKNNEITGLKDNECPTCGFEWSTSSQMLEEIQKTSNKIFQVYNSTNKQIEKKKSDFRTYYLDEIQNSLSNEIDTNKKIISSLISGAEFTKLTNHYNEFSREFNVFLNLLTNDHKYSVINIINTPEPDNKEEIKKKIIDIIKENIPDISLSEDIQIAILSTFQSYFDSKLELIKKLELIDIESKRKYIENQYYNAINGEIKQIEIDSEALQGELARVNEIIDIYDEKIKEYTSKIINQVTIPFYIFTGKILQNHSLGTGLVLDLSIGGKDPSFKITPRGNEHEVSYTLSSGQLSATVVSLMLVLNIVYNKSKFGTILIDDPLQTMDEINSHSLIELLKHNFGDQQIILSTHENEYSKLFRYKYAKFNLSQKNISLKNEII